MHFDPEVHNIDEEPSRYSRGAAALEIKLVGSNVFFSQYNGFFYNCRKREYGGLLNVFKFLSSISNILAIQMVIGTLGLGGANTSKS